MGTAGPGAVTQVGGDIYHRATYTAPALTRTAVTTMAADTMFNMNATYPAAGNSQNQGIPSVLYVANGPAGAGCPAGVTGCTATTRAAGAGVFVAFAALGSNPNIFAFDETTGLPVWTGHVGAGGDGIRGTPAIDGTSRRIFIAGGPPHQVHAVSIDTGAEVTTGGWPVTVPFANSNDGDQNQHGASFILNNTLYVPFGGHYGDGGNYRGVIFAVDITNPANTGSWTTASSRSGIWGAGGLASDGVSSIFTPTGNTSDGRGNSDSEEMVRLTGMAAFTRSAANVFFPAEGAGWDGPDLDFSASTPAYVPLTAGATPSALLVAPAKAGRLYVLDATNLSQGAYNPATHANMAGATNGGALADLVVSNTGGESVYTSPTIYTSESGLHATINVGQGDPNCPGGNVGGEVVVSVAIQPGKTPIAAPAWCAANKSGGGHYNYPPISTTSDGKNTDAIVWFMAGQTLQGLNGDTGATIVTATGMCNGTVPSMSFPMAVKNRIVVGTLGGVCAFSPGGT
jgi:hypothetical protein